MQYSKRHVPMITAEGKGKRDRVIEHGEVFTPPDLVNAMLDLVANECEREDSRFLEPACGDGNFLEEVLRRRLAHVGQRHRARQQWEAHALLGLACLYGIELLPDNTQRCRERLQRLFKETYFGRYESKATPEVTQAAKRIVELNIIQGDALSMTGPTGAPLVLTEWALIGRGKLKRRLFEFRDLTPPPPAEGLLFAPEPIQDEEGHPVFVPNCLRDLPPVHYLDLGTEHQEP